MRLPHFVILCSAFRTPLPTNPGLGWWCQERVGPGGARLSTPALVIVGQHDIVTPEAQTQKIAHLFDEHSRAVHVVPGGQHAMPRSASDLRVILAFVQALRRERTSSR